jgi:hypothetical protein
LLLDLEVSPRERADEFEKAQLGGAVELHGDQ